jgi:hypothetical protein
MRDDLYVFDFDKTLTYKDTISGFYHELNKKNVFIFRIIKRICLIFFSILYKTKLISNYRLKSIGVALFLKGLDRDVVESVAEIYSKKIKFNKVYYDIFLKTPQDKIMISSASFEIYLKYIFPNERLIGAKIKFEKDKVESLLSNNYGKDKIHGIRKIYNFYTDSFSDKPLMDISENVYLVKNDLVNKIK